MHTRGPVLPVPFLLVVVGIQLVALAIRFARVQLGEPGEYLRHLLFAVVLGLRSLQGVAEVLAVERLDAARVVCLVTGKPAVSR
jgi:hypothetical protein